MTGSDGTIWLLERFRISLGDWLFGMVNWPTPDWEQQPQILIDHTRYYGLIIHPISIQSLHDLLEARVNGTGPFEVLGPYRWDEPTVATGDPIQLALTVGVNDATRTDAEPAMHQEIKAGETDFDRMLTQAQGHLDEIVQILESLGARMDAAKLKEDIQVESDVDAIEELIWRYNDAIDPVVRSMDGPSSQQSPRLGVAKLASPQSKRSRVPFSSPGY